MMKKQKLTLLLILLFTSQYTLSAGQGMGHDSSGGYTDEEHQITQEYIHEGKVEEAKQGGIDQLTQQYIDSGMNEEEAKAKAESIMAGTTEEYQALGIIPLELVSQLYTMVIGVLPSSFTTKIAYTEEEISKSFNAERKDMINDYTKNGGKAEDVKAGGEYLNEQGNEFDTTKLSGDTKTQAEEFNKLKEAEETAKQDAVTDESQTEKENQDYCKLIAMAGEVVAGFQAQMDQQNITSAPKTDGNQQLEALYAAKQSHVDEAENCLTKHKVWGATGICYGVMLATSHAFALTPTGALANPKQLLTITAKLGASLALSGFYLEANKMHEDNAAKVAAIIAQMPNKGDCNPVSQRNCYCSHETTKNDAKYCAPQMHQRRIAANSIRTSCVDNKMEADPNCSCMATDTCYQKTYMNMLSASGYGAEFTQAALDGMKSISNGSISSGNYADGTSSLKSAHRKLFNKANSLMRYNGSLNKNQKNNANLLAGKGIPSSISSILAAYPETSAVKNNTSRFRRGFGARTASKYRGRGGKGKENKVLYFGAKKKHSRSSGGRNSKSNKLAYRKGAKTSASGILTFAEKAAQASQINKNSDRAIFEIISRRYKVSGWRELELENK